MSSLRFKLSSPAAQIALCVAVVAGLTVLRGIFAVSIELRVDEAYYWTWSKENVVSFLDHPPLIAWFVQLGTALFGDSNFGVRFPGLLAMLVFPLTLPLVIASTQIMQRLADNAAAFSGSAFAVLIAFDVVFIVVSWIAFEWVIEP